MNEKILITDREYANNLAHCLIFLEKLVEVGQKDRVQFSNLFGGHVWGADRKTETKEDKSLTNKYKFWFYRLHVFSAVFLERRLLYSESGWGEFGRFL